MIKPSLHHVTIKTTRLDEMIAWYALVIGAQVNFRDASAAWMSNDGANHRIGRSASETAPCQGQSPSHHCILPQEH